MAYMERQATLPIEMAETISEHRIPPLLAAAHSLDMDATQDSADYALVEGFDDAEFPYAPGLVNGIKCCSKCGATKTPQWREGPFGPKTLCNACGVKRTRKLRAELEGSKRRKMTASPQGKPYVAKAPKATYSPDHHSRDSYGSQDCDDAYPESHYYAPSPAALPAALRRPTRRAAEEAAVKTARYARTGDWTSHAAAAYGHAHPSGGAMLATPTASDFSLPSSECPEEVSWTPLATEMAVRSGLPGFPFDCYAAVNLMTISKADGSSTPQEARASAAAAMCPEPVPLSQADMEATLAKMDVPSGEKLTSDTLCQLYKNLPPAKVAELIRLNQELDSCLQAAQSTGVDVGAVAAMLAAKQAAAIRARDLAVSATKRLRRFMMELDTQFGVPHKTLPRIRTSPKKHPSL